MAEQTSRDLSFDDMQAFQKLCGAHHENLALICGEGDVVARARGNGVSLEGSPHDVDVVEATLTQLYELICQGHEIYPSDMGRARQIVAGGARVADVALDTILVPGGKRKISPKNLAQKYYIDTIGHRDLTFGIGPAGTGKTYLAMAQAVAHLQRGDCKRIILTRPAVEAGEHLGFLPGDMAEKVNPYLRPLYDALYDMLDIERVQRLVHEGVIEIAPLAFMRGRTLNDCFVVLDEAQNTTREQMKMFLTRLGFRAKAVVTGDITQTDLEDPARSGLVHARDLLQGIEGIGFCPFKAEDVVRHHLVMRIVQAYDEAEATMAGPRSVRSKEPVLLRTDPGLRESSAESVTSKKDVSSRTNRPFKEAKEEWIAAFERDYLFNVLTKNSFNITHASRDAGIDRKYFRKLMSKYEMERPADTAWGPGARRPDSGNDEAENSD